MRTHVWATAAALVVALGFTLRAPTAPVFATGNPAQQRPSFFTRLTTTTLLTPRNQLASFFAPLPSISAPNGVVSSAPVPMTNGVPNAAYFKMFDLKVAPRAPR